MNYIETRVPAGTKFISDIPGFTFPNESCIIDKTICGCGFTEWCLNNNIPVILCSPRKILLSNKTEQHNIPGSDKRPVYYFNNEKETTLNYDSDLNSYSNYQVENKPKYYNNLFSNMRDVLGEGEVKTEEIPDYIKDLKNDLVQWVISNQLSDSNFVPKILVTYDSLRHVIDALQGNMTQFVIVVDEFQSIFTDSTFKPDVELNLVDLLSTLPNKSIFISATPMMERYLDSLPYFSNMTVYKLIWDESAIEKVNISRKYTNSIRTEICQIIDNYKKGLYPTKITSDGVEHQSMEAVFFVNSVTVIIDVLKKSKLKSEEVNILCADTDTNRRKLTNIGHSIGKVPINSSDNKMFTFCTRTTYIGADFYSTNAMTFVFSDLSIQSLTIDISLDLLQIVGRQRLPINVFRNEIVFYYHKRGDSFFSDEKEFNNYVLKKELKTQKFLTNAKIFNKDDEVFLSMIKSHNRSERYKNDYVGYSRSLNEPVENILVKLSEQRAWEITRPDYLDNILIKKTGLDPTPINLNIGTLNVKLNPELSLIDSFKQTFLSTGNFSERMSMFNEFVTKNPGIYEKYRNYFIGFIPLDFRNYINKLGIEKIQTIGFSKRSINAAINYQTLTASDTFLAEIKKNFIIGNSYSLADIKEKLKNIYLNLGQTITPKASSLLDFCDIQEITWIDSLSKKRIHGYKIINYK